MADDKKPKAKVQVIEKRIQHYGMEEIIPIFADVAAVRHSQEAFSLMFFQAVVPITEDRNALEGLTEIPAKCVAKVVVTPSLMFRLYDAITTNMEKWKELQKHVQAHPEDAESFSKS